MIRYGPDSILNKPKKIAINLLAKYKPMINLTDYRKIADGLDQEAKISQKLIDWEKEHEIDLTLTAEE